MPIGAGVGVFKAPVPDPNGASGQYTMVPFQIIPRDGPSCKSIYGMGKRGNYKSIVSVPNHSFSRGFVHINRSDPTLQLTLNPRYLSHPLSLERHGRHTQWLETIAATEPMTLLLKKDDCRIHGDKPVHDVEAAKYIVEETFISHYRLIGNLLDVIRES